MVYHKGHSLGHYSLTNFLCDLHFFLEVAELTIFVDQTTFYSAAEAQECVIENFNDSS